jgi:ATP-dependent Lon protease
VPDMPSEFSPPPGPLPLQARVMPLLPLRDLVIFPTMVVPLLVGREKSVKAVEEAARTDREIVLCAQKVAQTNEPSPGDVYEVGTVGVVAQLLRLQDGTLKVLIEGKRRCRVTRFNWEGDFHSVVVEPFTELAQATGLELEALSRSLKTSFDIYAKLNKRVPQEAPAIVMGLEDPSKLGDTIASHLTIQKLEDKQALLENRDVARRLEKDLRTPPERARDPAGGEAHPHPHQKADGEEPAGVLPQRADAGHPEGARRERRVQG